VSVPGGGFKWAGRDHRMDRHIIRYRVPGDSQRTREFFQGQARGRFPRLETCDLDRVSRRYGRRVFRFVGGGGLVENLNAKLIT